MCAHWRIADAKKHLNRNRYNVVVDLPLSASMESPHFHFTVMFFILPFDYILAQII